LLIALAAAHVLDGVAGVGEVALDGVDLLPARGLEGELDEALPDAGGGERAVVVDLADIGARLGHHGGAAGERARPIAEEHGRAREPAVLDEAALDDLGDDVDDDIAA